MATFPCWDILEFIENNERNYYTEWINSSEKINTGGENEHGI